MSISSEIQRINTNIANAYTQANAKGATLPENQNSANLADTISSISSGGNIVEEKDVNFYDYDGTRLYSYTLAEVQNLTELPALPSHTGLTCQGWNWTLADIKAEGKETDVGAMYITDDGKTRLYINIAAEGRMTVPLCFQQSVSNGVEVNWGDGSTIETFSDTNLSTSHNYSDIGEYIITLNPIRDCTLTLGISSYGYGILGEPINKNLVYLAMLKKINIGKNVTSIVSRTFKFCNRLKTITIPNSITTISYSAFEACSNLVNLIIPKNVLDIGYSFCSNCVKISHIILSKSITIIPNNFANGCISLQNLSISSNVTSIGNSAFSGCNELTEIKIPNTVTSLRTSAFSYCYSLVKFSFPNRITTIDTSTLNTCRILSSLSIPNTVTSINNMAFYQCYGMKFYDFSSHTAVPTLSNTNAFQNISTDCKIIVPDDLYENWIAATNWSSYSSKIIKKSDWDAL